MVEAPDPTGVQGALSFSFLGLIRPDFAAPLRGGIGRLASFRRVWCERNRAEDGKRTGTWNNDMSLGDPVLAARIKGRRMKNLSEPPSAMPSICRAKHDVPIYSAPLSR